MLLWHRSTRHRADAAADQRAGDDSDRAAHQADDSSGPGAGGSTATRALTGRVATST